MSKIKAIRKLPRLVTIPGLEAQEYRGLQAGEAQDVKPEAEKYLLAGGWCEIVSEAKTKKEKGKVSDHG